MKREYIWLEGMALAVTSERKIPEVYVDNGGAGFNTAGAWTQALSAGRYRVYVRWVPITGEPGDYEVYVRWPAVAGVSSAAPFTIESGTGTTSLTQDQTTRPAQWNLFGQYTFNDSATQGVKLGTVWDSTVLADAIHFVPVAASSLRTNIAYAHLDHLGTIQKMTDANQALVWEADYKPFCEATINSQPFYDNPLRFPGQYLDAETGLHQNWHRDYDPGIGRYLQSDPLGPGGGLLTYPSTSGKRKGA